MPAEAENLTLTAAMGGRAGGCCQAVQYGLLRLRGAGVRKPDVVIPLPEHDSEKRDEGQIDAYMPGR
jgi:hypothetical protein